MIQTFVVSNPKTYIPSLVISPAVVSFGEHNERKKDLMEWGQINNQWEKS